MKIIERVLWGVVCLAILLKILHLPLGSFFLIIGMSSLSIFYFWLTALLLPKPTVKDQNIALSIVTGIALSTLAVGVLFKLQFWPNYGFFLTVGSAIGAVALAWALWVLRDRPDLIVYRARLLNRLIPFITIAIFFFLLPTRSLIDLQYRDPKEAQLRHDCYTHAYPASFDSLDKFTGEYVQRGPAPRP